MARQAVIRILMAALIAIVCPGSSLASKEASDAAGAMLLVLDNCDKKMPPSGDAVSLLNSRCELVSRVRGLNVGRKWGGCRAISASEDGRFFAVCESPADRMTVYETATCRELWSLSGKFESAAFANGLVYALNGESVFAIDSTGTIVKHSRIGGVDIVVDPSGDCLWIVGLDIKKCNLHLQLEFKVALTLNVIETGAFSVDVNPDGSVWVAERAVPAKYGSKGLLVKVSPAGKIIKTIDLKFSPNCVRVDRSDSSIWATGKSYRDLSKLRAGWPESIDELNELAGTETYTQKYDSEGKLLLSIGQGGNSIDPDPSDGSAWIAGRKKMWHYSGTGTNLATYSGVSANQKWLAVVHRKNAGS